MNRCNQRNSTEHQHELAARLLRLQDEERRRIARELHDTTGQTLCGLKLAIKFLQKSISTTPEVMKAFEEIYSLVDEALRAQKKSLQNISGV